MTRPGCKTQDKTLRILSLTMRPGVVNEIREIQGKNLENIVLNRGTWRSELNPFDLQ